MTLRQLLWMTRERKRVMGELAAWHALTIPAMLLNDKPPSIADLNPYGETKPVADSEAVQRLEAVRAQLKLRALAHGGNVPEELAPEAAAAVERMRARQQQEAARNSEAEQAAIRRILSRAKG